MRRPSSDGGPVPVSLGSDQPAQAIVMTGRFAATIHGLSAVERHLAHLRSLGLRAVVYPPDRSADTAAPALSDEVLWIDGDTVLDARLYRAAWEARTDTQVSDGEPVGLAKLTAGAARARLAASDADLPAVLHTVEVGSLETYVPEMRRHLRPYWVRLHTRADGRRAERHILDAAQKGNLDFPARYVHPYPENALATALVDTPLTPNHVTIISALVGFVATALFVEGRYLGGLALAVLANVLDGVDGKLARMTLRQSVGGDRLDHALDIGFEFSWYLAFGWSLSRTASTSAPMAVGVAILLTMVACRVASGSYRWLSGWSIHDHRPFDRAFRLVAGRRNIYVLLLLVGHLAGYLSLMFQVVLGYAVVTLSVYLIRNVMAAAARPRGRH